MELDQVLELIAHSGDGVMVANGDGRIVIWNQAAEDLMGYSAGEALGRPCFALFQGADRYGNPVCFPGCAVMTCARQGGALRHFELSVVARDGQRHWLDVSTIPLHDASGRLSALAHLLRAISTPGRLERMLKEALWHFEQWELARGRSGAPLPTLTSREREVLHLLSQGASTASIATRLVVTPKTVRNHIQRLFIKLGVHSRLEAVALVTHGGASNDAVRVPTASPHATVPHRREQSATEATAPRN